MSLDLQSERLNRGLSIRGFADEIGVDMHALWRAERGGKPSPANAKVIADYFGVSVTSIWPVEREAA